MLGWLKRKAQLATVGMMEKDIDRFLAGLRGASPEEVGAILTGTYHWMNCLEREYGWNLNHPDLVVMQDIVAQWKVNRLTRAAQKQEQALAPGLMVWLHSLRASANPELRLKAREMWGQLMRGLPHVNDGAEMFKRMVGLEVDLSGAGRVPDNLRPLETKNEAEDAATRCTPAQLTSEAEVEIIAVTILAQVRSLIDKEFPSDDFTIGYVFGVADAFLQGWRIAPQTERATRTLVGVFSYLYGGAEGCELLGSLPARERESPQVSEGMAVGFRDIVEFLGKPDASGKTKTPTGFAAHYFGLRDQRASEKMI